MRWTHQIPTQEGYYFIRHKDESAGSPKFRCTVKTCYVLLDGTLGNRVLVQGPCQGYIEYGIALELYSPKHTEWAGPIPMPEENDGNRKNS